MLRGLGENAFLIADPSVSHKLETRDAGWCDKRAKAYVAGGGPGVTEPAIASYRLGFDGLPVVYRFKAEAAKKYVVCLAATSHIIGSNLEKPQRSGDLVFEYRVEGCAPKTLDWFDWTTQAQSAAVRRNLTDAQDVNGDGAIEVSARRGRVFAHPAHAAQRDLRVSRGNQDRQAGVGHQRRDERQVHPAHQRGRDPGAGLEQPGLRQERRELCPHAARLCRDDPGRPDQDLLASRAADPPPPTGEHGLHRACLPRRLARRGGPAVRAGEGQGAQAARSRRRPSGRSSTFGRRSWPRRRGSTFPIRSSTTSSSRGWPPGRSSK